ncbi:MAG: SMC family ATPase, partial [Clostridiales bacterium]|nr:SMC family ATPase [Clostridiales bacterium]
EYASLKDEFANFRDAEEKEQLEKELALLGDGNFVAFAEENGKSELLRGEYAVFKGELAEIYQKHPDTAADVLPLIEKYTALSAGDKTDFARIKEDFAKREQRKAALNKSILDLERRNGAYRAHLEKLQQLQTEGVRLKKEFEDLEKLCAEGNAPSLALAEQQLLAKKRERKERAEENDRAARSLAEAEKTLTGGIAARDAAYLSLAASEKRLKSALEAGGFKSEEEARTLAEKFGDAEAGKQRVEQFKAEYAALLARAADLKGENLKEGTEENVHAAREKVAALTEETEVCTKELTLAIASLKDSEEKLVKKRALEKEHAEAKRQAELFERLKKLFEGNKFMEFVAEEYLQNVTRNASGRLLTLTDGRYFLRYDGGFSVGDNFNGGNARGVYTLSGGETFLVSLSLALALSAEICARSLRPIEFFFLDEGFGTLDERLVDTVMDSLFKLKSENFSIGIISHVEELKHRIDRKLTVKKATEKHGSQIQ